MPCKICNADFNIFNWKLKCGECSEKYCKKCLTSQDGVMYCEKCTILLKRPPDRSKLMELRSKDLQDYLQKHNIPTRGIVEKRELVDLLCAKPIPVRPKRFTANFAGSVPNLRTNTLNELFDNLGATLFPNDHGNTGYPFRCSQRSNPAQPAPSTYSSSSNASQLPRQPPVTPRQSPTGPAATHSTPNASRQTSQESHSAPPPPGWNPAFVSGDAPPTGSPTTSNQYSETRAGHTSSQSSTMQGNSEAAGTASSAQDVPSTPSKSQGSSSPRISSIPKLSDFGSAEQLTTLTSKQLKTLLTLNRVDFKGCVEKSELLERAERLWSDNQTRMKNLSEDEIEELCKLCMDAPLDCVLLECGHIATCINCGKKLAECPICRQYVSRVVRTFKA